MSIQPGYSGQEFMPEASARIRTLRSLLPARRHVQVDGGIGPENIASRPRCGRDLLVAGTAIFGREDLPRAYRRLVQALRMSIARALELAERGRGTTHPNPVVGAVVVRDGEVVGEGWHERKGGPHAEVVALRAAGERARGRDALRDDGAVRAPRHDAAVHRGDSRRGRREGRRGVARSESGSAAAASSGCAPPASTSSSSRRSRGARATERRHLSVTSAAGRS